MVLVQTEGDASQCDDCRARGVGERLWGRWGGVEFELAGIERELHDSGIHPTGKLDPGEHLRAPSAGRPTDRRRVH